MTAKMAAHGRLGNDPNEFAGHIFSARTLIPKPQKVDEHRRYMQKARVDKLLEMKT